MRAMVSSKQTYADGQERPPWLADPEKRPPTEAASISRTGRQLLKWTLLQYQRASEEFQPGLGLAIAQQFAGTLTLANRDGGGLEARLEFSS
jgi:hypothetical protein